MKAYSAAYRGSFLAISSSATPAAIGRFDAQGRCAWSYTEAGLKTGEGLLAALGQHFKGRPEGLNYIVLDRGPGQFTGLRAGIGLAQGLSMGWRVPILAIDSSSVMAWSAWEHLQAPSANEGLQMLSPALSSDCTRTRFVSIRDARLGAFYVATFESFESLAAADCNSVNVLGYAQVLELVSELSAKVQEDASVVIASDAASHERLALSEAGADGGGTQSLHRRSLRWIVSEASSLLGALARLGLTRIQNGGALLSADAIQAHYVRDEVAMDLSAQRAYRRSRSRVIEA